MTFQEWWDRQDEDICRPAYEGIGRYTWISARLQTMTEVRDWLKSNSNENYTEGVKAVLEDLWVTMAANVQRGGEWATSVIND